MKKNIFYALLANIVNAGFSWLMLIFLIRFGSKEDIGMFGLAQAIALPVHMFFTLKLRTIQLSDINNEFTETDYVGSRFFLSILNLIFVSLIAILFYFNKIDYILAIIALGISYSAAVFREFYISVYQVNRKNNYFFISNLIQGSISVGIFVLVFLVTYNIIYTLLFYSLSKVFLIFIDNIFYKINSSKNIIFLLKKSFNFENKIFTLIKLGLPLGVTSIISAMFTSIPRLKLEDFLGLEALGVFTTLMSLIVFLNLFMTSFIQAILPNMTLNYFNNYKIFKRKILLLLLPLTLFLIFILFIVKYYSYYILYFIFGNDYIGYSSEFFLVMISGIVLCYFHFSNFLLNIQKTYHAQVYIYLIAALVCLISTYYLIPLYGLKGAIYSTLICYLIGIILSIIVFFIKIKEAKSNA